MRKNSLSTNGLSMTQAQTISNLINQEVMEIKNKYIHANLFSKRVTIAERDYVQTPARPLPKNIVSLVIQVGLLSGAQAFLMENIKAKQTLLEEQQSSTYEETAFPEQEKANLLPTVNEDWAWGQLSLHEVNNYLQDEALAAHIGLFVHNRGVLDTLRKTLPTVEHLSFIKRQVAHGVEEIPLTITFHHTSEELFEYHNQLVAKHRECEQRVNYIKAKIKNLVTDENARINGENSKEITRVNVENSRRIEAWRNENKEMLHKFEAKKLAKIREIAATRIAVPDIFKNIIDEFMDRLSTDEAGAE